MFGKPSLWRLRRRKEVPLKDRINTAVFLLGSTTERLKALANTISEKDAKLFQKCIDALLCEDSARATIYANECAEIRKLARLMISSQIALEQACLRLNTISTISDVLSNVAPIMEIIHETGSRLKGIVPSVTGKLQEVDLVLKSSLTNMGSITTDKDQASTEVHKILEEANNAAEETVRHKFPEFPFELTEDLSQTKVPVALMDGGGEVVAVAESSTKERVYEYVKQCKGELSIAECASRLQMSSREVEKTLLQLEDEGKVSLG